MEASAEVQSGHVEGFSACCPWRDKGTGWVGQSKDSTRRKTWGSRLSVEKAGGQKGAMF